MNAHIHPMAERPTNTGHAIHDPEKACQNRAERPADQESHAELEEAVILYCRSLSRQCADMLRGVGRDVDAMKFDALSDKRGPCDPYRQNVEHGPGFGDHPQ